MNYLDFDINDDAAVAAQIADYRSSTSLPAKQVEKSTEFDAASYNARQMPVAEAKRITYKKILTALNKKMTEDQIWTAYGNNSVFRRVVKVREDLPEVIQYVKDWDFYKNHTRILWDLPNVLHSIQTSKSRSEFKTFAVVLTTIAALHISRDVKRKAYLGFRYTAKVAADLFGLDLDPRVMARKWQTLEKRGYVKFEKGQQGGDASRVELLKAETPYLTRDQRLEAVRGLLKDVPVSDFKTALTDLLVKLAELTTAPSYNDSELEFEIADLMVLFKTLTKEIGDTRKVERLLEEVEYFQDKAVVAEIEEMEREKAHERVSDFISSGGDLLSERTYVFEEIDWGVLV